MTSDVGVGGITETPPTDPAPIKRRTVQVTLDVDVNVWPDETPQALAREFAEHIYREYETVRNVTPMKAVWVV